MSLEQPHDKARLLAEQAIAEASADVTQRDEARAAGIAARKGSARIRAVHAGLLMTVPILVVLVLVNARDSSLFTTLTATTSSPADRQQLEEALRTVVDDIESFRADYAELPESLSEVGMPTQGAWSYTKKPGGGYLLEVTLRGYVRRFDGR